MGQHSVKVETNNKLWYVVLYKLQSNIKNISSLVSNNLVRAAMCQKNHLMVKISIFYSSTFGKRFLRQVWDERPVVLYRLKKGLSLIFVFSLVQEICDKTYALGTKSILFEFSKI